MGLPREYGSTFCSTQFDSKVAIITWSTRLINSGKTMVFPDAGIILVKHRCDSRPSQMIFDCGRARSHSMPVWFTDNSTFKLPILGIDQLLGEDDFHRRGMVKA
jgi:hypothetical protein